MDNSQRQPEPTVDVSIIIPLMNEEDNVTALYQEVATVMDEDGRSYELIFVDDGSWDRTIPRLREATAGDGRVTIIQLNRNFGQTAALSAGFRAARGAVLVPMDGDLQNDPRDVPKLVAKLDEPPGADVVSGWRKNRHDKLVTRKIPSRLANKLIARATWTNIHDFGCTLKAYRREVIEDVSLYGEMHRFLPAICKWRGARVVEQVVNHRPRVHGQTKYGLRRTIKVLFDLTTVKFLGGYLAKPMYFFGKAGVLCFGVSLLALFVAILQKYGILYWGEDGLNLNRNVLVLFSMMLFLCGLMMFMMGVLSELMVRIYHEAQGRTPYKVRNVWSQGEVAATQSGTGEQPQQRTPMQSG